ncbi:hypothetical protein CCMA1212_004367 [Trichoderma ghanense]|uniref:Uncharacterized protein n=1 Tax=Trichoderma ghanense TaxID=65468 RepID=A0ABY2H7U0_9HYPO
MAGISCRVPPGLVDDSQLALVRLCFDELSDAGELVLGRLTSPVLVWRAGPSPGEVQTEQ